MNLETDYLVIGSGAAGLSFALKAAEHSHVIVVTKGEMNECNTNYAQGGICCVTYEPDTFQKHIDDTMVCGGGICDMQAVELVVTRAPQLMKDLVQWGTRFDKTREGRYELAREGGHSFISPLVTTITWECSAAFRAKLRPAAPLPITR